MRLLLMLSKSRIEAPRHTSGALVWLSLFFLTFVALLPFSAGLMGHLLIHPVSQLFYFGNQLAIAALLNVTSWSHVIRICWKAQIRASSAV